MRIQVKSVASSISTTFNWTLAFLVTKFFSNMVRQRHLFEHGDWWRCLDAWWPWWWTWWTWWTWWSTPGRCSDRGWRLLGVWRHHHPHLLLLPPLRPGDEGQEPRRHPAALQVPEALLPWDRRLETPPRRGWTRGGKTDPGRSLLVRSVQFLVVGGLKYILSDSCCEWIHFSGQIGKYLEKKHWINLGRRFPGWHNLARVLIWSKMLSSKCRFATKMP